MSKSTRQQTLQSMSELDINSYMKSNPLWGGVFANDELKRPDPRKIYILNLENSDESGSHWTLLYAGQYYDPFGVVPTKEIAPFVKSYNKEDYQGFSKASCGYFALYAADNLTAGRPAYQGLIPGKPQYNEDILKKYFY